MVFLWFFLKPKWFFFAPFNMVIKCLKNKAKNIQSWNRICELICKFFALGIEFMYAWYDSLSTVYIWRILTKMYISHMYYTKVLRINWKYYRLLMNITVRIVGIEVKNCDKKCNKCHDILKYWCIFCYDLSSYYIATTNNKIMPPTFYRWIIGAWQVNTVTYRYNVR